MMNIKRGLLRIWVVASVVWIALCAMFLDFSCFYTTGPWCEWWVKSPFLSNTYTQRIAVTFGAPLAVLLVGFAVAWAVKGFKDR